MSLILWFLQYKTADKKKVWEGKQQIIVWGIMNQKKKNFQKTHAGGDNKQWLNFYALKTAAHTKMQFT